MNTKQINSILWSGAATLAAAAVASLAFSLAWPLEKHEAADSAGPGKATTNPVGNSLPPLAAFEEIWNRPLRQPLGTAMPIAQQSPDPVPVAPPTAAGTVPVSLVGTIGSSLAMFKTPANAVEICGVGESFNGVMLLAVRPAEVDVRFNGRVVKLTKPAEN